MIWRIVDKQSGTKCFAAKKSAFYEDGYKVGKVLAWQIEQWQTESAIITTVGPGESIVHPLKIN